jgi:hypothetical protein
VTEPTNFDLNNATDVLRRTPAVIAALLTDIDDSWARANEGPETFSPFDVVGHLIEGEETDWIVRAEIIRSGDPARTFAPYDRFGHWEKNKQRTLSSLLDEFAKLRAKNIDTLQSWSLTDTDLRLTATHPKLGVVSLRQLLSTWVVHDLGHIAQITRVMAKRYKEDIGPWSAFLPIVSDRPKPQS